MWFIKPGETELKMYAALEGYDLSLKQTHIISFVGAGGKTSSLLTLANEYKNQGKCAIVTTTTHMYYPEKEWVFIEEKEDEFPSNAELSKLLETEKVVWIAGKTAKKTERICEDLNGKSESVVFSGNEKKTEKIGALSEEHQRQLAAMPYTILAEADGARRLPFKLAGEKEPVLFPGSTIVFGILGIDALGKPIGECAFRSELLAQYLGKTISDVLLEEDYVKVMTQPEGLMKYVTKEMDFRLILNKADTEEDVRAALHIREMLPKKWRSKTYITHR